VQPGDLASGVALVIADAMEHLGLRSIDLARAMRRSEAYVARRLRLEAVFTHADLEAIAELLGMSPDDMVEHALVEYPVRVIIQRRR